MATYTGTAVGKGNVVSSLLGYLLTDQSLEKTTSATKIMKDATQKAINTWNGFLKNSDKAGDGINIPAYFTPVPERVSEAAYYYALEFIAEEYTRIRIGNVGAAPGSKIPANVIARARALTQMARDGIARFEQWCAAEAAVYGADFMAFIGDLGSIAKDSAEEARTYWQSYRADLASLDTATDATHKGVKAKVDYGTYGYSLKNMATQMMAKRPGFSGARNPQIGQYWQGASNALMAAGKDIMADYEKWVADTKIQYAVSGLGI